MAKDKDVLVFEGVVESIINDIFKVKVNDNYTITAKPSGKFRMSGIKCVPGDIVRVETSPYSPENGRVVYRLKDNS